MNNKPTNENDEALRSALHQWRTEAALPPRFQEQVWQRIEKREADLPVTIWPLLLNWLRSSVARPVFAVAYAMVLLITGLTGGYIHAQRENAKFVTMIETRYVQSIDPYQK